MKIDRLNAECAAVSARSHALLRQVTASNDLGALPLYEQQRLLGICTAVNESVGNCTQRCARWLNQRHSVGDLTDASDGSKRTLAAIENAHVDLCRVLQRSQQLAAELCAHIISSTERSAVHGPQPFNGVVGPTASVESGPPTFARLENASLTRSRTIPTGIFLRLRKVGSPAIAVPLNATVSDPRRSAPPSLPANNKPAVSGAIFTGWHSISNKGAAVAQTAPLLTSAGGSTTTTTSAAASFADLVQGHVSAISLDSASSNGDSAAAVAPTETNSNGNIRQNYDNNLIAAAAAPSVTAPSVTPSPSLSSAPTIFLKHYSPPVFKRSSMQPDLAPAPADASASGVAESAPCVGTFIDAASSSTSTSGVGAYIEAAPASTLTSETTEAAGSIINEGAPTSTASTSTSETQSSPSTSEAVSKRVMSFSLDVSMIEKMLFDAAAAAAAAVSGGGGTAAAHSAPTSTSPRPVDEEEEGTEEGDDFDDEFRANLTGSTSTPASATLEDGECDESDLPAPMEVEVTAHPRKPHVRRLLLHASSSNSSCSLSTLDELDGGDEGETNRSNASSNTQATTSNFNFGHRRPGPRAATSTSNGRGADDIGSTSTSDGRGDDDLWNPRNYLNFNLTNPRNPLDILEAVRSTMTLMAAAHSKAATSAVAVAVAESTEASGSAAAAAAGEKEAAGAAGTPENVNSATSTSALSSTGARTATSTFSDGGGPVMLPPCADDPHQPASSVSVPGASQSAPSTSVESSSQHRGAPTSTSSRGALFDGRVAPSISAAEVEVQSANRHGERAELELEMGTLAARIKEATQAMHDRLKGDNQVREKLQRACNRALC